MIRVFDRQIVIRKSFRCNSAMHTMQRIDKFEKQLPSIISETIELGCGCKIKVYTIDSIHSLTQFIGYGKYINREYGDVFLRGQRCLFDKKLTPSLYRGEKDPEKITRDYDKKMDALVTEEFKGRGRVVFDPLMQHYGVKTPYLDLVDNVWVALWFALHRAESKTIGAYKHIYYYKNDEKYSYIFLIAADTGTRAGSKCGVYEGKKTILVDLRKATPSFFLRPHAQHAYMLRKKENCPVDYSDLVVGIAKIQTELGLKWLGQNQLLTVNSLFPDAESDTSYAMLLKKVPEIPEKFICAQEL